MVTSLYLLSLLVCVSVVRCTGNNYRIGGCPKVVVMKGLDFDKFLGDWYVMQRFSPVATCTKLTLEKGENDKYTVNETSRPFGINFYFHRQYSPARKINFLRNDTSSIFRLQRSFTHFTLSTFGIVDTDYDNYAVVWGCDPVLFGSLQNIDILTRDPKSSKETIEKARDVVKEMKVDSYALDYVDQSRCGYGGSGESEEGEKNNVDQNTNNIVVDEP